MCVLQALHKYKQKRKNLNFTKKIRYESRKQLAQARPRVKGQFVRMASGATDADAVEAAVEADAAEMLGDLSNLATAADAALAAAKVAAEDEGMDFQDDVSIPLDMQLSFSARREGTRSAEQSPIACCWCCADRRGLQHWRLGVDGYYCGLVQDESVDNDEEIKEEAAAKWQAGAAQPPEEDDDDNVVNSPQDIFNRVRSCTSHLPLVH